MESRGVRASRSSRTQVETVDLLPFCRIGRGPKVEPVEESKGARKVDRNVVEKESKKRIEGERAR